MLDERSQHIVDRIKKEIEGCLLPSGRIDMDDKDHLILAAWNIGRTESDASHHKDLMGVLDLFKRE